MSRRELSPRFSSDRLLRSRHSTASCHATVRSRHREVTSARSRHSEVMLQRGHVSEVTSQ
eukprot:2147883-Rhodomonas_salina.1